MVEVKPLRTVNVHSSAEHLLRERLIGPEVSGRHGEMRQRDLDMKRRGKHVTNHHKAESGPESRNGQVNDSIAKPVPEHEVAGDLEVSMPPSQAISWTLTLSKEDP